MKRNLLTDAEKLLPRVRLVLVLNLLTFAFGAHGQEGPYSMSQDQANYSENGSTEPKRDEDGVVWFSIDFTDFVPDDRVKDWAEYLVKYANMHCEQEYGGKGNSFVYVVGASTRRYRVGLVCDGIDDEKFQRFLEDAKQLSHEIEIEIFFKRM